MSALRQRMIEEMQLRGFAKTNAMQLGSGGGAQHMLYLIGRESCRRRVSCISGRSSKWRAHVTKVMA